MISPLVERFRSLRLAAWACLPMKMLRPLLAGVLAIHCFASWSSAQLSNAIPVQARPAVEKGVVYFNLQSRQMKTPIDAAFATFAMCKAGVPAGSVEVQDIA